MKLNYYLVLINFTYKNPILNTKFFLADVVWELRRGGKNRYKPLTKSQCEAIEKDYNFYTREKSIGKRTHSKRNIVTEKETIVVDYDEEKMYSPHEGSIKRQFQKGLNYNFMKF